MNRNQWRRWLLPDRNEEEGGEGEKKDPFRILFPILLLLAVIFLLLPNSFITKSSTDGDISDSGSVKSDSNPADADAEESLECRLEEALACMKGVGAVKVVLSYADSGERIVLKDEEYTQSQTEEADAAGGTRYTQTQESRGETVTDAEGNPYILRETTPKVQGVLVLAEGASSAIIREEILSAVQALFDLPITSIHVAAYQK